MNQQTQQRPNGQVETRQQQAPQTEMQRLLAKRSTLHRAIEGREERIETLLPDFMKGQGKRLIERAQLYWDRSDSKLKKCTDASFIACVLNAAELGFAIDGKMCHAVPFNTKIKDETGERWESIATVIVDYKAMIAVAKRHGLIQDCWARVVFPGELTMTESNGNVEYTFTPELTKPRDKADGAIGVLAVATHKLGWFRCEFMPMADVQAIRGRSKAGQNGPWLTDPGEMAKKTGIKRLLKTFSDDPGLLRALDVDADSDEHDEETNAATNQAARINRLFELQQTASSDTAPQDIDDIVVDPPFNPPTEQEIADAAQTENDPLNGMTPLEYVDVAIIPAIPKYTGQAKVKAEGEQLRMKYNAMKEHLDLAAMSAVDKAFIDKGWPRDWVEESFQLGE